MPPKELKSLIKEVHEQRMAICTECPNHSDNAKKEGYTTIRPDVHCVVCKCPLGPKTKSLRHECPQKKWLAIVTETEQEQIEKYLEDGKL